MRLILVRHGQTACNVDNIWHGWDQCELTAEGQAQAEAVGHRLASEPITAIYSSDSPRAQQTAQAIAVHHGLKPIPSHLFRERFAGEYEGVLVDDIVAQRPAIWDERAADFWSWSPPGGETFLQVRERLLEGIAQIQAEYATGTVVVVSHMSPVRVLISHYAEIPIERTYDLPFPSTGVSIFQIAEDGSVQVETLNDAEHVNE